LRSMLRWNVADFETILRGLQDTMTVMEGLERRQAERSEEHQKWLEDLTRGWSSHEASIRAHEESIRAHEESMREHEASMRALDEKLNILADAQMRLTNTVDRSSNPCIRRTVTDHCVRLLLYQRTPHNRGLSLVEIVSHDDGFRQVPHWPPQPATFVAQPQIGFLFSQIVFVL
jgi:hypothetical protein